MRSGSNIVSDGQPLISSQLLPITRGARFRLGLGLGDDFDKKDILNGRTIAFHHEAHPGGAP